MVLILFKAHSHRKKAKECHAMAMSVASPEQREYYLELASMWDVLADDADIRAQVLRRNPPPGQRHSGPRWRFWR
jgi:hypothetical protein